MVHAIGFVYRGEIVKKTAITTAAAATAVALSLSLGRVAHADSKEVVTVAGAERSYELHVPPQVQARPALLVALHPRPASGSAMRYISGFNKISDAHGFLVAYPDGRDKRWNGLTCCGDADDVAFIRALIQKLQDQHNVDPDRIYLAGVSSGGELAYRFVGESPGIVAAVAAVASARTGVHAETGQTVQSTVPREPVSLITLLGAKDEASSHQMAGLEDWRRANDCHPVLVETPFPASVAETARCRNGSEAVAYVFNEVGHVWPGAANIGPMSWPDAPLNAADVIWRFFRDHPRQK